MAKRGKIQDIADECGVDHRTVRRALERADLKAGRGGYDFDAAIAAVRANADPARLNGHAVTRDNGAASSPMMEARVRHEALKARRLELENAKVEGELINRSAVIETCISIITTARTALLTIGNRAAEKVANKSDVREIARLIETEIRDVLGALGDEQKFLEALEAEALA
jgi:hypothetical protein